MDVQDALALVDTLIYKPGWTFRAEDHRNRFESTIKLRIDYPARNSDRDEARRGYPTPISTYAELPIIVGDCTEEQFLRRIMEAILQIEEHEAREFFRVRPTYRAPFHPHRIDGMEAWGDNIKADLQFGVA